VANQVIVENTVRIILKTSSTNPECNGDCDYAVVELTPILVEQLRRRVDLAREVGQQDNDLYELRFWGGTADFYDHELIEACQEAVAAAAKDTDGNQAACDWLSGLEEDGHALLPPTVDLGAHESQRTECDQVAIQTSPLSRSPQVEIVWTTIPKHTDIDVTTRNLPLAALENYVRSGRASEQAPQ
jgi:hypothetical protein